MTGVIAGLMQEQTGVFAEWMQGWHLYVLRYSVSVFSNLVSMLITTLGLSGYSNRYRATVAIIRNTSQELSHMLETISHVRNYHMCRELSHESGTIARIRNYLIR
jgi:hypothetical protein